MATESDNVNSGALGTLLAVGAIATLGIALVVTALVRAEVSSEAEAKEIGADRPYRDLVAEQTAKMAAPATYVDRARGLVSLPIDRAMEVTVAGLIKDPNSATPPAPLGGTGGGSATETGGAAAEMGGTGGTGGAGGIGGMVPATEETKPPQEATHAEGTTPSEDKKDEKKKDEKKKDAPKPHAPAPPVPASPAPAAPAPAPAPAP